MSRKRYRVGLGITPYAIVVYWLRQVRGRRAIVFGTRTGAAPRAGRLS